MLYSFIYPPQTSCAIKVINKLYKLKDRAN